MSHCVSQRKQAVKDNNHVLKRLYKLLSNALYGKSLQSDLKYNTDNILVEIGMKDAKLCGELRF